MNRTGRNNPRQDPKMSDNQRLFSTLRTIFDGNGPDWPSVYGGQRYRPNQGDCIGIGPFHWLHGALTGHFGNSGCNAVGC